MIDNVGGLPLSTALKTTQPGGVITTCGNVAGAELSTTVFPFILRGLRLIGIDSQNCPYALRKTTLATPSNRLEATKPESGSKGSFDGGDVERDRTDFTFGSQRQDCSAA